MALVVDEHNEMSTKKNKKILVVDDEPLARARLIRFCENLGDQYWVLGEAANGQDCLDYCKDKVVDIVLLDIEMPGLSGLQVAQQLQTMPHPPAIVFCTAYGEFALQAFEAAAIDYLLKPVEPNRLKEALEKASLIRAAKLSRFEEALEDTEKFFWVKSARDKQKVEPDKIRVLQADSKYVNAITDNGSYLLDISLKQLESQLGESFLRIHRATLVNTKFIDGCSQNARGEYLVSLQGVDCKPQVSRRLLPGLLAWIKQHSL